MDIYKFWSAVLSQDADMIRAFFHPDAYINWHNTDEHFNVEDFIRANCEYPGHWAGEVEHIMTTDTHTVTVTHVFDKESAASFHVTSFIKIVDGSIVSIDEYWGDDGDAPQWRKDMRVGSSLQRRRNDQYVLAIKHIYGDGVPEDNERALELLSQAHEMGHIEATYNLGICYHYGYGTEADLKRAFELYLEAAGRGYGKGMELVGRFYNRGIYVEKNRSLAVQWLQQAIDTEEEDVVEEARKELALEGEPLIVKCVWEHNGNDSLLYVLDHPGAFARGASLQEATAKLEREVQAWCLWTGEPVPERVIPEVVQDASCELAVRDADSDALLKGEEKPLTEEEYAYLKRLALKSASDFLALYDSVPDKNAAAGVRRKTFYGQVPRTAEEMYTHTKNVNAYYFGEIGVEADNEGNILECRKRGFEALETMEGYLQNQVVEGSYGESWSLRKVLRRFIWHDRIHAKAMYRMAATLFGEETVCDPFFNRRYD